LAARSTVDRPPLLVDFEQIQRVAQGRQRIAQFVRRIARNFVLAPVREQQLVGLLPELLFEQLALGTSSAKPTYSSALANTRA
jgi:hypothetical protein